MAAGAPGGAGAYAERYARLGLEPPSAERLARGLGALLQSMVALSAGCAAPPSFFNSKAPPRISLRDYLLRALHSRCSAETLVLAAVYLDRFLEAREDLPLCAENAHKLFAASLLAAAKFNDDLTVDQEGFARVLGVNLAELAELERCFLAGIGFRLAVAESQFAAYARRLAGDYK